MPAVDMDVVKAMVRLSNSLLDHLHANPQEMIPLLEYSKDWPAVASVVSERDARRVLKYPEIAVAELYKPVTKHLGARRFFPPVVSRNRGIFHEIAEEAAQVVYVQSLLDSGWREQGLPSFFDFIDHKGVLQQARFARPQNQDAAKVDAIFQHYADLPRKGKRMLKTLSVASVPRPEQKSDEANADTVRRAKLRESLIALKYYLELASAPEPRRTLLRNNWRALRVAKFAALKPADKFGQELHQLLIRRNSMSTMRRLPWPRRTLADLANLAPEGQRHGQMVRLAADLLRVGFVPEAIFVQLYRLVSSGGSCGLPPGLRQLSGLPGRTAAFPPPHRVGPAMVATHGLHRARGGPVGIPRHAPVPW